MLFYVKVGGREDGQETEWEAEVREGEQKRHCIFQALGVRLPSTAVGVLTPEAGPRVMGERVARAPGCWVLAVVLPPPGPVSVSASLHEHKEVGKQNFWKTSHRVQILVWSYWGQC